MVGEESLSRLGSTLLTSDERHNGINRFHDRRVPTRARSVEGRWRVTQIGRLAPDDQAWRSPRARPLMQMAYTGPELPVNGINFRGLVFAHRGRSSNVKAFDVCHVISPIRNCVLR